MHPLRVPHGPPRVRQGVVLGCTFEGGDCDDLDVCTDDACDPTTGCSHVGVDCDDGDPCTLEACDLQTGTCDQQVLSCGECVQITTPEHETCDDGNEVDWDGCTQCLISEFQVNSTTDQAQDGAAVAAFPDGSFVVVWSGWAGADVEREVYLQRYRTDGTVDGFEVVVNDESEEDQLSPDVASAPDGRSLVVWSGYEPGSGTKDIVAQIFDADGSESGDELALNSFTDGHQTSPAVAEVGSGYMVVWVSQQTGINGRFVALDGSLPGGELGIDQSGASVQHPDVASLAQGGAVAAWTRHGGVGGDDIVMRLLDATGTPSAQAELVNLTIDGEQEGPSLAALSDGGFMIAWSDYAVSLQSARVVLRRFDAAGQPLSGEDVLNETTGGFHRSPSLVASSSDGYLVSWSAQELGPEFLPDVLARQFDASGLAGPEIAVNSYTDSSQSAEDVAWLAGDRFVVAYSSGDQDGSGTGVFAKMYRADGQPLYPCPCPHPSEWCNLGVCTCIGEVEVLHNGVDDDCDPATLDAGPPCGLLGVSCPAGFTCEPGFQEGWDYCHSIDEDAVYVPESGFWMGCDENTPNDTCSAPDEGPSHWVDVPAFLIQRTEVSIDAYSDCPVGAGCDGSACSDGPGTPAACLTREEAESYCAWLPSEEELPWRLCTESEWEKAARGGCETVEPTWGADCQSGMRVYPWSPPGDSSSATCEHAWMGGATEDDNACGMGGYVATTVDSTPEGASPYGALHMSGNVSEWVADCYHPTYDGAPTDGTEWTGGCDVNFVSRGGSYADVAASLRAAKRGTGSESDAFDAVGFRCCRSAEPPAPVSCLFDDECDDGDGCTVDTCPDGWCSYEQASCESPPNACYDEAGSCVSGACEYSLIQNCEVNVGSGHAVVLALGVGGHPILAYNAEPAYSMHALTCGDAACTSGNATSVIDDSGWSSLTLHEPSIALGADGLQLVAYRAGQGLRVASRTHTAGGVPEEWSWSAVDAAAENASPSLGFAPDGLAAIAYRHQTSAQLKLARCEQPSCGSSTIKVIHVGVSTIVSTGTALSFGEDGYPVVGFAEAGVVKLALCVDEGCSAQATVRTIAVSGSAPSIAIDPAGHPVLAFTDKVPPQYTSDSLHVARCSDAACSSNSIETIDTASSLNEPVVGVGSDGWPILAYRFVTSGATIDSYLGVASCSAAGCTGDTIVSAVTNAGNPASPSLAVGAKGLPVIAYGGGEGQWVVKCASSSCEP